MKKLLTTLLILISMTGCSTPNTSEVVVQETTTTEVAHTRRVTTGRYYINGEVITNDGHIWGYTQNIISEKPSYDNEPVYVVLDDNGTPYEITDDIIIGLVLDTETAIYDALEEELSDSFEMERENNNIHIIGMKE